MNVRKRGLALLMCICMIFTLLPFSALADATAQDVVYGRYGDDGKWREDKTLTAESSVKHYPADGETSDNDANIDYSKTAVKNNDGSYDVTLTIKSKTSETAPGASAVVLVIDTSTSMKDNRIAEAKKVATKFVNDYGNSGADRYIAIVNFSKLAYARNFGTDNATNYWLDASKEANRTKIIDAINELKADGGTNLEQGLSVANSILSKNAAKDIAKDNKFVIALTDGEPTYAGIEKNWLPIIGYYYEPELGNGKYCTKKICNATETTATTLKGNVNTLYTVCYGAENDGTYEGGLTVGKFLEQKIASPGKAYNATDGGSSLSEAFAQIYNSIEQGISSGFTVTDPMGQHVNLVSDSLTGNGYSVSGSTITWEPKNGITKPNTDGSKTTTYTLTYRVTLGEVPDDGTYPLNKNTTLVFKDGETAKTLHFNVPGVYREAPKYTVTYKPGDHGTLTDADNSGNVVHPNLKKGDLTPDAPKVNAADGYYFTGWKPTVAEIVTGDAEYTAQYEKKNEITVVAKSATKTYDGSEQSISGFEQTEFTINGKIYTVSGLTASVSGIDANTYTNEVTGTAVVKDDNGNDVTGQFTVNTQNGTLTIKKAEVTITADNKEKFVDEADPEFTYTISGIVEADKDKKVTLTIIRDKVGTPEGELAGSYSIIPKDASIEGSNNYTFKYVNGTLTIKERNAITVTLTATKLLDGEDATGSEFEFELYQIVEGKEVRIEKVKNNNAAINFTPIQFNKEGTYTYYMREVAGGDPYIKYDDTVYKIVITVDKGAGGNYEVKSQTYTVVSESDEAVPLDKITFSNFTVGSLVVKKTVSGNAASTTKEFTFIVKLIPNSDTTNNNIIYGNVTNVTVIDNEISFKLKAGDSKTINGLPDGIRYTVQELDSNGYTVSAKVNDDPVQLENNMLEGTIAAGRETKVAFNNHKSHVYPPNPPIMDEIIVEITGNSDSVVYDGTEHSVKDYTVKISDPRYTEADFTFTGKAEASGVNAGTYEMGLKAEQFKNTNARFTNVKFVIKADGVLTITPKDLIITAGSKTEYGPTPVTCDEWTVSGLAAGDKVESVKITGIQSVPGSSPNVPSDAVIKNAKGEDVTKNYAIKYVNGTLTMLEVLNKEDHFNYIIGTPEGLSLPTANVTRAEVATIFFRLMTDDARAKFDSLDNSFSDVAKGKWYNRAISTLANAGIIKGDPAGTYRPGDPITRAEMAAIIARFGDFKEGGKTFNDISGHWAQKYIELAASNGWINGNPDGTFKPNNNITRAETVAMINRVLDRQTKDVSDLLPVSQMTNWSDNMDTAKWYYRDMQEATNNHKAERVGNSIYEKWTEKLPDIDWASYQI